MISKFEIGTSGWVYKHWREVFYPEDLSQSNWLGFFSQHFDTVEINSSFYRQPTEQTVKKWSNQVVNSDFCFAVKINKYITHLKKLDVTKDELLSHLAPYYYFGNNLGPILIQLPPFLEANSETIIRFLSLLPSGYKFAIEPRHESWFSPDMISKLSRYNVALVLADSAKYPVKIEKTADFGYVRFHGSKFGESLYSEEELIKWAIKLRKMAKDLKKVYIYFNNDFAGNAIRNAIELRQILRK